MLLVEEEDDADTVDVEAMSDAKPRCPRTDGGKDAVKGGRHNGKQCPDQISTRYERHPRVR